MTRSQEIALRCAAAIQTYRRQRYMERFGLSYRHPFMMLPIRLLDQLDACKSDEARRLILGRSERMEG